jgi:hypothetical protein
LQDIVFHNGLCLSYFNIRKRYEERTPSAVIMTLIFAVGFGALAFYYDRLLIWLEPGTNQN